MILLTLEGHLGGIILVNKGQGISHAEWWVCGEGHVTAVIAHDRADYPAHRVGGLPFYFHQGMSILDELCDGVDMPHWSHTSCQMTSLTLALSSTVPWVLGFKRIKMAVVRL